AAEHDAAHVVRGAGGAARVDWDLRHHGVHGDPAHEGAGPAHCHRRQAGRGRGHAAAGESIARDRRPGARDGGRRAGDARPAHDAVRRLDAGRHDVRRCGVSTRRGRDARHLCPGPPSGADRSDGGPEVRMIDALVQDIRYGMRSLAQSPGLTLGVVLTLGLGIGANVTMFSLVDRMLFRPPPFLHAPDSTHRVYLMSTYGGTEYASSGEQYPSYVDLTGWSSAFLSTAEVSVAALAVGTVPGGEERHSRAVRERYYVF